MTPVVAMHVSVAWAPFVAAGFALVAAVWLLLEVRRATRQRVAVPVDAIFVDDGEPFVAEPVFAEPVAVERVAVEPVAVEAILLDEPEPERRPEREPEPVVAAPVRELTAIGARLAALTDAVDRLADRIDAHTTSAVVVPAACGRVHRGARDSTHRRRRGLVRCHFRRSPTICSRGPATTRSTGSTATTAADPEVRGP